MNIIRTLYNIRHNVTPEYLGKNLSMEEAYGIFKEYLPNNWDIRMSESGISIIDWECRLIDLLEEHWTEEILLHQIGTVILSEVQGSYTSVYRSGNYNIRSMAVRSEKEIWEWVESKVTKWNWKSELLKMKSLDWYRGAPLCYLKISSYLSNTSTHI